MGFASEVAQGERFAFGLNWARFLSCVGEEQIRLAEQSLRNMLRVEDLIGKTFLDAGCGSGLFSLAARRLGAKVHSFDYDPHSVACTAELRRRYFPSDSGWVVGQGDVLDPGFLQTLGTFDVVYSWGVLHHTGNLWGALANVADLVLPGGQLFVAVYNDQGRMSRYWSGVKRLYNRLPPLRSPLLALGLVQLWGGTVFLDLARGSPLRTWREYHKTSRGMSPWRDVVDWVGGYPFEVARPEKVFDFLRGKGFELQRMKTWAGGHGCNEYVFLRQPTTNRQLQESHDCAHFVRKPSLSSSETIFTEKVTSDLATPNEPEFLEHNIIWTDDKVGRFWNYRALHTRRQDYFSEASGEAIIDAATARGAPKRGRVLDLGCGPGYLLEKLLARGYRCTGLDFSAESVSSMVARLMNVPGFEGGHHAGSLPSSLAANTFDLVFSVETIEHLLDSHVTRFLQEAVRLLRSGGTLVITTPNDEDLDRASVLCPDCGCVFHVMQHVQRWTPGRLTMALESLGLETVDCKPIFLPAATLRSRGYGLALRALGARLPQIIYVGRKP